jgi:hypothetical protein
MTIVALAAGLLLGLLRVDDVASATLARDVAALRAALGRDQSIAALSVFRGQLAADMLFLVAYGLLLRASIRYVGRWSRPRRTVALAGVVALMAADATENASALGLLRQMTDLGRDSVDAWRFALMNGAALAKWTAAGLVLLMLAAAWARRRPAGPAWRRRLAIGIAIAFGIGGAGALGVALSFFAGGSLRDGAAAAALAGPSVALLLQFRLLDLTGVMLRFLYLARVPLLVLGAAAALGPVALGLWPGLLGGILDVASARGIGVLAAACVVLAYACVTQISLVREYGWLRTFDVTLRVLRGPAMARAVAWTALGAVASLLFAAGVASPRLGTPAIAVAIAWRSPPARPPAASSCCCRSWPPPGSRRPPRVGSRSPGCRCRRATARWSAP